MAKPKCVRCLKPTPATTTEDFTYGNGTYRLTLCDKHADAFQTEMFVWIRLAELTTDHAPAPVRIGLSESARRALAGDDDGHENGAVLAAYIAPRSFPPVQTRTTLGTVEPPETIDINALADKWFVSTHAEMRMIERQVKLIDIFLAAEYPQIRSGGREPELTVHERNGVRVVVNEKRHVIVTCAYVGREAVANAT